MRDGRPTRSSQSTPRSRGLLRTRRGVFLIDVGIGLGLIAMVGVLLATAVRQQNQAMSRLGDSRAATRLAEDVLTSLQAHTTAPAGGEATVQVVRSPATGLPGNVEWADVTVVYRGRSVRVTGLVPGERGAR